MGTEYEITSQALLETFCAEAPAGATCVYHRGYLTKDRDAAMSKLSEPHRLRLDALADYAQRQSKRGILTLLQRRTSDTTWEYLAVRTRRAIVGLAP